MSALPTWCPAPRAAAIPSWWARLACAIRDERRIRRATRGVRASDDRMLGDVGLERGGPEDAAWLGQD
jgi:hypothetical protein